MGSRAFTGGLVLAVLTLVGGVASLRQRTDPGTERVRPPVEPVAESRPREEGGEAGFLGVIIVEESVDLATRLDGRVEGVRVQVGSEVRQGQVVATLDAKEVKQELLIAEAELSSSRAELEMAALSLEKAQERLRRRESSEQLRTGAVSQEEVSEARYEQRMAAAKLEIARTRVLEQEARVGQLRQRVEEATLRAPFDGVVAGRFVHPGALIRAGQPVVHLLRRGRPQVRFAVPASEVHRMAVGQGVRVEVAERGLEFGGRVVQVAPEVDVASLMVFALADVEMAQGTPVPAGTAVRVKVLAEQARARSE